MISTHTKKLSEVNRVRAGESGAIEAVVNAMKTHVNNVGVSGAGCGALGNITFDNGKHHP